MQTLNFSRPILPPLNYLLYLPERRRYVRTLDMARGMFTTTIERSQACALPEREAREVGLRVIRALDEPVELRDYVQ